MRGWSLLLVLSLWPLIHAGAHEDGSPLSAWYRSLKTIDGASCCNMTDCAPVEARLSGDHWEVLIGEGPLPVWEAVPKEAVLRRENREGRPVLCRYGGQIRCFIPPAES